MFGWKRPATGQGFACALLLAGGLSMVGEHARAASAAGATPAHLEVSQSGAATYTLPISVPQGIGKLQPDFALHYDSQAGRGIAGPGWSLEGVSAIKRCQQLPTRDAPAAQAITLTVSDRFCLDGMRLVMDGGTASAYGANGTVYRTVIDGFSRITSAGVAGAGPKQFTVETKSGLLMEYGATDDSRVLPGKAKPSDAAPATAVMWSIDKISDRYGNALTFTYAVDTTNGSQVLSQATYNGGLAYVKFTYVDDPNPRVSYLAGGKLANPKLLKEVTTYVRDDSATEKMVRHYILGYDQSDAKGGADKHPIARLISVSDCGADGVCLGDVKFDWAAWSSTDAVLNSSRVADGSRLLTTGGGSVGIADDRVQPRTFADMNGDGKADIVAFKNDGVYVLFSSKQAGDNNFQINPQRVTTDFESGTAWKDVLNRSDLLPRHLVDMNNDGYPDIVGLHPDYSPKPSLGAGIYLALWDPTTLKFKPATLAAGPAHKMLQKDRGWGVCSSLPNDALAPRYLVDMNNDGIPDLLGIDQDGIYISYATPDAQGNVKFAETPTLVSGLIKMENKYSSFSLGNYLYDGCDMGIPRQPIYTADMNGDGYPDLVAVTRDGVYVLIWDAVNKTYLGPTPVFTDIKAVFTNQGADHPTYLYDMNGDGYPDLVNFGPAGVTVALWSGKGFLPAAVWTSEFGTNTEGDFTKNPHRVADMNGDGYPDLVDFRNDGIYVGLSDGQAKIYPATRWSQASEFTAQSKDITGNTWSSEFYTPRALVDVDGDGLPDVVGFGDQQVRWARVPGPAGPRITKVTDARGAVDYIQYSVALDHTGFYTSDTGVPGWPVLHARTPMPIVSQLSEADGLGGFHNLRYRYGGRKTSAYDGDLGFRWMSTWDELTHVDTRSWFQQGYPLIGRVGTQEVHRNVTVGSDFAMTDCSLGARAFCVRTFTIDDGSTIHSVIHNWNDQNLAAAGEYPTLMRKFVFEGSLRDQTWELDGTSLPLKQESFSYDEPLQKPGTKQWGNLTQHAVWFAEGTKVTTDDVYEDAAETSWRIGRLSRSTVTSVRPAISVNVPAVTDAPQTPDKAPPYTPKPSSSLQAVLSVITSLLLDN